MYNSAVKSSGRKGGLQGDVAIIRVDALPDGAKRIRGHIVALGEATGHHHILDEQADVYTVGSNIYFVVDPSVYETAEEVGVRHQEHAAIAFELGVYQVIRQVEYDGEDERHVRD